MSGGGEVAPVDPFDLPEWIAADEVTWRATSSIRGSHRVTGELSATGEAMPCDLLAGDRAYPAPVLEEKWRHDAHQAWNHGQVLLVSYDGRLTLVVPGTDFTADRVLETLARLAKAVGVKPSRFVAALRL